MTAAPPIKVFQVATGNVGSEMIKRIANPPHLQLTGVHCYSSDKIGRTRPLVHSRSISRVKQEVSKLARHRGDSG
jgi:aspartate-semialdehyde dehydrogenase